MANPRYNVITLSLGREVIKHGPMQGCIGLEKPKFDLLNKRPVGMDKARKIADEAPIAAKVYAVVDGVTMSEPLYHNGKEPGHFGVKERTD